MKQKSPTLDICKKCKHYKLQFNYATDPWNVCLFYDKEGFSTNIITEKYFKIPEPCPYKLEHTVINQ